MSVNLLFVLPTTEQFRLSISARIRLILDGPDNLPLPPVPVFTEPIGEDLGVIGDEDTTRRNGADIPEVTTEASSGEVLLKFIKHGHMGVWIESQIAADTAWDYLAIDTSSPYNDTRHSLPRASPSHFAFYTPVQRRFIALAKKDADCLFSQFFS